MNVYGLTDQVFNSFLKALIQLADISGIVLGLGNIAEM